MSSFTYKLKNMITHDCPDLVEGDGFNATFTVYFGQYKRSVILYKCEMWALAQVNKSAKVYKPASEITLGTESVHNMVLRSSRVITHIASATLLEASIAHLEWFASNVGNLVINKELSFPG